MFIHPRSSWVVGTWKRETPWTTNAHLPSGETATHRQLVEPPGSFTVAPVSAVSASKMFTDAPVVLSVAGPKASALLTTTFDSSGVTATKIGSRIIWTRNFSAPAPRSTTETVFSPVLQTNNLFFLGASASPVGRHPTGIRLVTFPLAVETTATCLAF